ncbi:MAG: PAS domain S-box protein [Desulfobacterales bacterium]|nr:PAS domain S-box protein [Desulfobacterales bacterium]
MNNKPAYEELEEKINKLEKKNEILLKDRNFLEALTKTAQVIMLVLDTKGQIVSFNPYMEKISGYQFEEVKDKDWFSTFLPGNDHEKIRELFQKAVGNIQTKGNINPIITKDGRQVLVEWYDKTFKDKDGNVIGLLAIGQDVTERLLSEKALRESEERYRILVENLPQKIFLKDKNSTYISCNQSYAKDLGIESNQIAGKTDYDFFPKQLSDKYKTDDERVMDSGVIEEFQEKYFKNGQEFWVNTVKIPVKDFDGSIICILGIFWDITEKKKYEEKLRQNQKLEAIGNLAGGIAHDFNNMIGVITGNISYALSNLNKEDELFEVLSDVKKSAKQAQSLTHQLLTFSKGGEPIKKKTDLNKLISEAAIFTVRGAKAKCNFKFSNDLWASEVDEGQINQVVGNLIINANHAMLSGGTITVRTENVEIDTESLPPLSAGRYIKIVFEDHGVGISKKHLSNIFEPYFTTKQKGSGLGLATTYSIIKLHGGHITVNSEIEKGTAFNIYLPASSMGIKEIEDREEVKHAGQGRILIMDDQEPILKMLGRMLNRMGYKTEFAIDGTDAVKKYREAFVAKESFDLVILDLTIPGGMGGTKTIIELLKIDSNTKAIVSSGYSNDPIMANYEDYGFCGVVPKPYSKAQLSEVLNKIFGEKG